MKKFSVFLLLATCYSLLAAPSVKAHVEFPAPSGFVNDYANLLDAASKNSLEIKLSNFAKESGHEIALALVPNLGGDTVEEYAVDLFEAWKVGKQGLDNGVLVVVSRDDRKVRIEVGYGLEGALTDAQSYWIIQNEALPAFREGNYATGLERTTDKIIAAVKGEVLPTATKGRGPNPEIFVDWFWVILTIPMWIASILSRSKSWWLGGVIGGVLGVALGLFFGFVYAGILAIAILTPLGLLFDYIVSHAYQHSVATGHKPPWWIGGGGRGGRWGGGGFGGFGGGRSGGGGASGGW